jgi:crotonobetainyl-CoA:carnitine CoA-transferase CaiB-like acyl-CoA transferase
MSTQTALAEAEATVRPAAVFERLWREIGLRPEDLAGPVAITGADPVVPSLHRLGTAASAALAAQGAAIAAIWKARGGAEQSVSVDLSRAVVPGLQTTSHVQQNGHTMGGRPRMGARNFFATADGRQIYLLRLVNYPELLIKLLTVLGCGPDDASMTRTVGKWNAFELEDAMAEKGAVACVARDGAEWRAHPQGAWLAARPAIDIEKIGESDPEPFTKGARPLSGVRVIDCTHVLAGTVTSRVLAEQGADVLHVSPPSRQDGHGMLLDTGLGKRSAIADLNRPDDAEQLYALVKSGDLFVQSWRPGALDRKGFSPEALAEKRPGIIYVSVSCYGSGGPWRERGGFEPLGQTACGLVLEEGSADQPKMAPTGTMNDYLVPYLASTGALAALIRRSREGGSYHVKVSLTSASMFVQSLGLLTAEERRRMPDAVPRPPEDSFVTLASPFGELRVPAPIVQYSATPAYWARPPSPVGHDALEWLSRAS